MTIVYINKVEKWTCLSSDTKPVKMSDGSAIPNGSEIQELDTGIKYTWDAVAGWQAGGF